MMNTCDSFKLQRETFYLSLNIYDRFMDTQHGVQEKQLKLIGLTCLFIASKVVETRAPKLDNFVYVSFGACSSVDIRNMELFICTALDWRLNSHVSVNTWTTLYLQLLANKLRPLIGLQPKPLEYPSFPKSTFIRVMKILDISCMDIGSRQFCSSVLAAAAFYLMTERSEMHVKLISGYDRVHLRKCVDWLEPFCTVINRQETPAVHKDIGGVAPEDAHNVQVSVVNIKMLQQVVEARERQERNMDTSISPPEES